MFGGRHADMIMDGQDAFRGYEPSDPDASCSVAAAPRRKVLIEMPGDLQEAVPDACRVRAAGGFGRV